jgi:hypothetical protein
MFRPEDSSFNTGPSANGLIKSIGQQYRLYLAVLGDIYKYSNTFEPGTFAMDAVAVRNYNDNWKSPEALIPEYSKDKVAEYPVQNLGPDADVRMATGLNLLGIFKQVDYLDIDWLGRKFSGHIINNGVFKNPQNSNFEFQEKSLQAFKKVEQLLKNIVPTAGKKLQANLTHTDLKEAMDELNAELHNLKNIFIPDESLMMAAGQMDFRSRMVLKIINALSEINAELLNYGANIFAVSYKAKHNEAGEALDSNVQKNCSDKGLNGRPRQNKDCQTNSGN